MNWTDARELRAQLQKLWDKGELLAGMVTGEKLFPKRLAFKTPTSSEMTTHFNEVRNWIAELKALPQCRVEMRELKHRVLGNNLLPHTLWIDSADDAIALIGKQRAVSQFQNLLTMTRRQQPALLAWLAKRPLRALELLEQWQRLLDIVGWLQTHPRPGIYLRQLDLAGVHSKFIENHRGVLAELLDLSLPLTAIDSSASGTAEFAQRYGFRDKPLRIRLRVLDPAYALLPGDPQQDIGLEADSFARLETAMRGITRVFITENEINFLAFPQMKQSVVIFGAGYGFEMLSKAQWLARCRLVYWGDIDTHGFAILDQLRSRFQDVSSLLMDRQTLLAHAQQWGEEPQQTRRELSSLTPEESALYDDLRDNRLQKNLRLEQERIGFHWLESALATLIE